MSRLSKEERRANSRSLLLYAVVRIHQLDPESFFISSQQRLPPSYHIQPASSPPQHIHKPPPRSNTTQLSALNTKDSVLIMTFANFVALIIFFVVLATFMNWVLSLPVPILVLLGLFLSAFVLCVIMAESGWD
ncbi:hypothetical protein BDZ45DRAFT_808357 [Acephala macrosclerotiorum]|nr:hypothetical protein BDZ45DRAFT_808357 [Acephala macrosclerotiorum]